MAKSKKPAAKKRAAPKPAKRKAPLRAATRKAPAGPAKPRKLAPPKRGVHDLGGLPGGPINREHHTLTPFEERVDALMMLLTNQHGIYKVDSLRRTIEDFNKRDYAHLPYYEKWVRGICAMLVEQGVLTDAEIEAKVAEIERRGAKGRAA